MRCLIKIYGPPVLRAIKTLEKIAIDMPEVCIMDTIITQSGPIFDERADEARRSISDVWTIDYFGSFGEITEERCGNIISKSGEIPGRE